MSKGNLIGVMIIILLLTLSYFWYQALVTTEEESPGPPEIPDPHDGLSKQEDVLPPQESTEPPAQPAEKTEPQPEPLQPEPLQPEPLQPEAQQPDPEPFQAGMNLLVYGHPQLSTAPDLFYRLGQLGVNSIAIVFPLFQEDWQASLVQTNSTITPTMEEIREVYQGKLLYSFNWDSVSDLPVSAFVPLLDYVGLDAYFPLAAPDQASVSQLEELWAQWIEDIGESLTDKPIIVTEAGMIPVTGAYRTPYAWKILGGVFDPEAQANYYEATYNTWRPLAEGIYWWSVTLAESNPQGLDYSPLRPPTESVLQQIFLN